VNWIRLIVLWGCIWIPAGAGAQPVRKASPIVLERADLMRTEQTSQGVTRYLDGSVKITQDTLAILADHAIYEEFVGRLIFTGNVHFIEPSRRIWADQAVYYEKDGRATAEGNVRIEQDSLIMNCNRVVYSEDRHEASFFGDVFIHSLRENAILTGNHGAYNRDNDRGAMTQNPRLVRYFSQADSMVITGNIIEYFFDRREATVSEQVHIRRGDFDASGDRLHYSDDASWARLTGNPEIHRRRDLVFADTVDAYFHDQRLRRILLRGNAVATSPVDSLQPEPVNRVNGKSMELVFAEDELDSIYVTGNARSTYYVREPNSEKGANQVSGDRMNLYFADGRIRWIYVEGGTEGMYYPEKLEKLLESESDPPSGRRRNHDP
jgi:lipopolysaccharide assembly outer membrane protein LptD (OstA)